MVVVVMVAVAVRMIMITVVMVVMVVRVRMRGIRRTHRWLVSTPRNNDIAIATGLGRRVTRKVLLWISLQHQALGVNGCWYILLPPWQPGCETVRQ